jgi:8-oxo-dGTP diphosphatase
MMGLIRSSLSGGQHWVSVAASIYDEATDSFLLIKRRDDGTWQPPGGLLERGERLGDGVVREVREETGVVVGVNRVSGVYESPDFNVVSVVFACNYLYGDVATSDETLSVSWVSRLEVPNLVTDAYSCRILDALLPEVLVRTTDEVRLL